MFQVRLIHIDLLDVPHVAFFYFANIMLHFAHFVI